MTQSEKSATADSVWSIPDGSSQDVEARNSITGLSNTDCVKQASEDRELQVRVRLDWLRVYVYGDVADQFAHSDKFQRLKEAAAAKSNDRFFTLLERPCEMRAVGMGKGSNHCEHLFHSCGIDIAVADLRKDSNYRRNQELGGDERPLLCIQYRGAACGGRTTEEILTELHQFAIGLGIYNTRTKVSEVHIAVDVEGVQVAEPDIIRSLSGVVCRARNNQTFRSGRHVTGISYGMSKGSKPDTSLTIYDKALELENEPHKKAAYEAAFGERNHTPITRYEFRLRRQALKSHSINATEDLFLRLGGLVEYLMSDWYRECLPDQNKRTNELTETVTWQSVRRLAVADIGGIDLPRQNPLESPPEPEHLVKQIAGCITSVAASLDVPCTTPEEYVCVCIDLVLQEIALKQDHAAGKLAEFRTRIAAIREHGQKFADLQAVERAHTAEIVARRKLAAKEIPISVQMWDFGIHSHKAEETTHDNNTDGGQTAGTCDGRLASTDQDV